MQAIIDTISNYWNAFIGYFENVFISLKTFLLDLPLLAFEKIWEAVIWLFTWASDSCTYCLSGAQSLPADLQGAFNSLSGSSIGSTILYCLQRSELTQCFQILTCGVIVWSTFKLLGFIKSVVF